MQRKRLLTSLPVATLVVATILTLLLFLAPTYAAPTSQSAPPEAGEDAGAPTAVADFTVVADGLANPRGLVFGPDGALYVAEAGSGGDGACITGPEGEVCYGETGAISRVTFAPDGSPSGQAQVVTGFASLALVDGSAGTGPHDVAFDAGGDMTVVVGLGADPAVRDAAGPFGADGINFAQLAAADPTADTWTNEVDLGAHEAAENPDGGVPDTNPFDLHPVDDGLLVADAGANALLHVTPAGAITTAAVFPDRDVEFPPGTGTMIPMQAVPTSVTVGPDGATYVGQLTGFPFPPGAANVWRIEAGGDPEVYAGGFSSILEIAFAADGSLYVLEMFTYGQLTGNPTGAVVRVDPDGSRAVVAREGLITPTGMTIGPDHALYVSNNGTSGTDGQVVRIPTRLSEATQFTALLSGDQEVPPVDTEASGVARFTLDEEGNILYEVAVRDIENITAAHIHLGAPGQNGTVVFPLYTGGGPFDPDNPISGELSPTPEQVEELLAGNYYVNVHTTAHPGGEMRGQIEPARTMAFYTALSGANEVPPVAGMSSGAAYLTLSADMTELHYRLLVHDIHGINAAHIHEAPPGVNGPVVFPLHMAGELFDPLNPVGGTLAPSLTQVATMLAGDYYANVHTVDHPAGAIRGQIAPFTPRAGYHALLTGAEEVPSVATEAVGVARYALSADLSSLDYHVAVRDITGISAAHLHTGWPGRNGPVAIGLHDGSVPFDADNPINGLLALDAQHVLDLISGYYYTNVHTATNPGGEIRGQVGGATVFGAWLSGDEEVPPVDTDAAGRAALALGDDATMLHYRVMVTDITGVTASHIHRAPRGSNGPVVFPLFTGGVFDEDNPVSGALAVADADIFDLLAGDFYVNVHTTAHPAGEIRGQVSRQRPLRHYEAALTGDQEVPPVDTEASGQGHFTLDAGRNTLHYYVAVSDITGVTASHIHKAPVGVNGPVVFPLFMGGGVFDPDNPVGGGVGLGAENLVDLLTGFYYVNVHTAAHPTGEIRGQIGASALLSYMPVVPVP